MNNDVLLSVIGIMWSVLFAVGGFWLKRISDKLDQIFEHRERCVRDFADRARNDQAHKEFYDKLAVHATDLSRLSARVDALEK